MKDSANINVEQLSELQLPLVNKFYKRCRYSAKAGRGEQVFVLKGGSGIVAAVRLQPREQDYYFLRSMCVDPERRGLGLGTCLLQGLETFLLHHHCYCYPFDHLQEFYGRAGFECRDSESAPAFMRDAYNRYSQQGRKILLMERQRALA